MIKKVFFLLLFLLSAFYSQAQELTVKSMEVADMDLSASINQRPDKNGKPCGLVKVRLAAEGAAFSGNVLGEVTNHEGEYWVYMSEGSYMLQVRHPKFLALDVNFRDHGIRGVQPKTTYVLTLLIPQPMQEVKKQKLIINYSPANAVVLIDSKEYSPNSAGHIEEYLPLGDHSYVIYSKGYIAAEGTIKLNGGSQRVINEQLEREGNTDNTELTLSTYDNSNPVNSVLSSAVKTFTVGNVQFRMIRVEGGIFKMGNSGSEGWPTEKPVHKVTLSSYSIGETEVTQELWEAVMGSNPSEFKGTNLPVERVSWEDCQTFINKLNDLTSCQFRLPTEAEWEYAARGGIYNREDYTFAGSNIPDHVAWHADIATEETHPVRQKRPNELGLYDMSGNVFEWCQDWYDLYERGTQNNPTGPSDGEERVFRGGSWLSDTFSCRISFRYGELPNHKDSGLGLRLAL